MGIKRYLSQNLIELQREAFGIFCVTEIAFNVKLVMYPIFLMLHAVSNYSVEI